jgi:cyclohexyl-isocyanide hydratase
MGLYRLATNASTTRRGRMGDSGHTPPPPELLVGMLLFPELTLLDLAGPYDVFTRMPGARVYLVAPDLQPIRVQNGLELRPTSTFEAVPSPLDILFVPGGPGQEHVMEDERYLGYIREQGQIAGLVTSVCTGSLILGAAGLLQGYRATTHWRYVDLLRLLGAVPVADERVVVDRNRITGAGVSAGIDFALRVASLLCGETAARAIQLSLEYDPRPPFSGGSPSTSDPLLVASVSASLDPLYERRRRQIESRLRGRLERRAE